ncbi:MAG: glycosyltransferase family 4 protein [Campylobacteraceae bacterium]|jgi:glycosyltransferase involved in cell wall biosynthesis|nr:glycosyltransferase family 4 protein [Campylobacteraceae bacterium]
MNILYVCGNNPLKKDIGVHQRTNLLYKALCKIAQVDAVYQSDINKTLDDSANHSLIPVDVYRPPLFRRLFYSLLKRCRRPSFLNLLSKKDIFMSRKINELTRKKDYDYIVVRYLAMAVKCGIAFNKKVIIDLDDLPEQLYLSALNKPNNTRFQNLYYKLLAKSAKYHTKQIACKVKCVYLPNKSQCALIPNSFYLPNIPYPKRYPLENNSGDMNIMFVGLLSWWPNIYGVRHFLDKVWDHVTKELPDARFNIIGAELSQEDKRLWEQHKGVNIVGFAQDLIKEYVKNSVVITPIYHGAGTNIKVLEAMRMGKALVATEHASRGFEDIAHDGQNVFIAKNDHDFAQKIVRLLKDRGLNELMGKNAKNSLKNKYSFSNFCKVIKNSILT